MKTSTSAEVERELVNPPHGRRGGVPITVGLSIRNFCFRNTPAPEIIADLGGGSGWKDPAMTDFRARGTIMGLAGLTAVFGMGTGGAPPVSSPESGRGALKLLGRGYRPVVGTCRARRLRRERANSSHHTRHGTVADAFGSRSATPRREPKGSANRGRGSRSSGPGRPVENGVGSGWSSRSAVRTGRLRRSPVVHSRPIDLVVFQEPSWPFGQRKPGLGGGFALRCLQRLSGPDLATRRCPERDSRHTRGRSSPILSY
jgi:hypothetical protein